MKNQKMFKHSHKYYVALRTAITSRFVFLLLCCFLIAIKPTLVLADPADVAAINAQTVTETGQQSSNFAQTVQQWLKDAQQWLINNQLISDNTALNLNAQHTAMEGNIKAAQGNTQAQIDADRALAAGKIAADESAKTTLSSVTGGCATFNNGRAGAQGHSSVTNTAATIERIEGGKDRAVNGQTPPDAQTPGAKANVACESVLGSNLSFYADGANGTIGARIVASCKNK